MFTVFALSALFARSASADDLQLLLHDPGDRPGPAAACTDPVCTSLLSLIDRAERDIGFAFYGFRDQPDLLAAMLRARARGVAIHGVIDRNVDGSNYYSSTEAWVAALGAVHDDRQVDVATANQRPEWFGGAARCPRPAGTRGPLQCLAFDLGDRCYLTAHAARDPITFEGDIMHDKFVVVDQRWVWTGSTNASDSCAGGYNANLVMVIDSPRVASWYSAELEQMYAGRFHGTKVSTGPHRAILGDGVSVELLFSPQDDAMARGVLPRLAAATDSIDVAVFFLTHKRLAQALIDAHRRGVRVRVLLDASGAANEYSKHEVLRAAGIPVRVETMGGKLHTKGVGIDGEWYIGGSMNWTNAGDEDNDENTLIVRSAAAREVWRRWFDALWERFGAAAERGRPDPESLASGAACRDGVDNDYDGAADRDDPGCRVGAAPPPAPFPAWIVDKRDGRCDWSLYEPTQSGGP